MNKSGIVPVGDRVLVLPDEIVEVTEGGIIIPPAEADKHQMARFSGTLVAIGPDAWIERITTVEGISNSGRWRTLERRTCAYSEPFAKVGDRVVFARYVGQPFDGEDDKKYRLLQDEDIIAVITGDMDLTEFRKREPLSGAQG